MKEKIMEIAIWAAPLVAGLITSVIIPIAIKRFALKRLQKKIDEVNSGAEFKQTNERLSRIEREILEMRGKRK